MTFRKVHTAESCGDAAEFAEREGEWTLARADDCVMLFVSDKNDNAAPGAAFGGKQHGAIQGSIRYRPS